MIKIRSAAVEDVPLILLLVQELAAFERVPHAALATQDGLRRDGWGPEPKFRCVIVEWKDDNDANWHAAAFALFFYNYSTFQGSPGLYLEDLFVRPNFRRKGIGKALFTHLAKLALREHCARLQWQVLDWNLGAIAFYESLGACFTKEWLTMRLEGSALEELATAQVG